MTVAVSREPPPAGYVRRRVADALATRFPDCRVAGISVLPGGTSSLVYRAALTGFPVRECVVKMAVPGLPPVRNRDVLRQARIMRALYQGDRPVVPEVLFEDPGDGDDDPPLFGMTLIRGDDAEPILTPASVDIAAPEVLRARSFSAVSVLANSVARDPADVGLGDEPGNSLTDEIERWLRACSTVDPDLVPSHELCAAKLLGSLPAEMPSRISHGDYRLGNTISQGSAVRCVIDWEIWCVADPRIDLSWMALFTDQGRHPIALRQVGRSTPAPGELQAAYESATGVRLPDMEWFHAYTRFREAAMTALLVKHGRRRTVPPARTEELAASCPVLLSDAVRVLAGGLAVLRSASPGARPTERE
jgi:aminoglycoside phosphotransferase (APT) family kinase protein